MEALRRLLQWLSSEAWKISSVTTDRSRPFPALIEGLDLKSGAIQHFYDGGFLVKWFSKRLRKVNCTGRP